MSGAPKRSPDEGGHSSSSRQTNEEIGSSYPKLMPSVVNDYTIFKMGPDGRVAKVPRSAYCDADRRSPLHLLHRMPSSSNDADMGAHPIVSESKVEVRDPRDGRDHLVENRDSRTEVRQLHGEAKRDSLSGKGEKDIRFVSRGEDNKETKYGKDSTTDAKNDKKIEKDGLNVGKRSNQLNWKESIEFLRGKKYSESHGAHVDPWPMSRGESQVPTEFWKEGSNAEDRDWDAAEPNEAAGEKKFDFKGEDRFKEKDAKLREWGDSYKERSERRSTTPVGNIGIDGKELSREEKDREDKGTEKWEKEKKDRERLKEKEKDLINTEPSGAGEKEGLTIEKEMGYEFTKITLHEKSYMEQMKQKNVDKSKIIEKEAKGRRKDGEGGDMDGDKAEKRSRLCDKEPDDGCAEGEGDAERDREGFGYGVQQRKRMYRSRGSPQLANRDSRFRSHAQENEGSQAKSEMSSVVYKVGECMRDLIKLWKEYELSKSDKNGDNTYDSPILEIRIPAEHVTATNRQVRGGQLWGTDIYTDDSDLVAVLMHTGYCRPTAAPPPSAIQELCATIHVLPPQDSYTSMLRNNVRSRSWGAGIGCSYRVERCCIVKKGGGTIDLEPCLTHTSAIEPTIAPLAVERTMTTRAAASNALRQQRFVREVTIQYNLCNEPWVKYSISVVADKGLKKPLFTSARLKKGEVLYLETHICRYELCFDGERIVKAAPAVQVHEEMEKSLIHYHRSSNGDRNDSDHVLIDSFRWSRCKKPLPQTVMRSVGIPLPLDYVEVLEENLDWEDVQWSQTGVSIAGKEYTLARVHFLSAN